MYLTQLTVIRKVTPTKVVSTFGVSDVAVFFEGTILSAQVNSLWNVALDNAGNLFVADGHRILKRTPAGKMSTFAGSTFRGYADGNGSTAFFDSISGLAIDGRGNLFAADSGNSCIRKITPVGVVTTFVCLGYATGDPLVATQFMTLRGLAFDRMGNLYVVQNPLVGDIDSSGVVRTFLTGYR